MTAETNKSNTLLYLGDCIEIMKNYLSRKCIIEYFKKEMKK